MEKAPLREDIFEVLTDKATVKLLKSALIGFRPGGNIAGKLKITKKQYSTRLHKLVQVGLIHKRDNVYILTVLGEVVEKIILKVADDVISNYWKLKAIDSFEKKEIPWEEKRKIIDSILSDSVIKEYIRNT